MAPPQQRLNNLLEPRPIIGHQQTITVINHQQHMLPVQLLGDTVEAVVEAALVGANPLEDLVAEALE